MIRSLLLFVFLIFAAAGAAWAASGDGPGQVVIERGGDGQAAYGPATFPHWAHMIRYRCYVCHPARFKMTTMELAKGSLKEDRPPFEFVTSDQPAKHAEEAEGAEAKEKDESNEAEASEKAAAAETPQDRQRAMHGPEGCGLCHKGGGAAFNVEFSTCARCHRP